MKKTVVLILAFLVFDELHSQLTKRNWIVGGSASISFLNSASAASIQYKQTDIQINTGVGYFFVDRFVAGIRPSFGYGSNNVGNSSSLFTIGPFVRYYFLRTENIINLVSEANYAHGFFLVAIIQMYSPCMPDQ